MLYDDEISRLIVTARAAYGQEAWQEMYGLAKRRALTALEATPPDPDGSWPGSALNEFLYIELRKLVQ